MLNRSKPGICPNHDLSHNNASTWYAECIPLHKLVIIGHRFSDSVTVGPDENHVPFLQTTTALSFRAVLRLVLRYFGIDYASLWVCELRVHETVASGPTWPSSCLTARAIHGSLDWAGITCSRHADVRHGHTRSGARVGADNTLTIRGSSSGRLGCIRCW